MPNYKFGMSILHSKVVQYLANKTGIINFWTNRKNRLSHEATTYIQETGNRISQVKKDLHEATKEKYLEDYIMITTPQTGEFLKTLLLLQKATKGIEIGTFTGFSTLCMAEALPHDGKLYTLDNKSEYIEFAKPFWIRADVNDKIEPIVGEAMESLNQLMSEASNLESFDFAFIDADKGSYPDYYEAAMQLLKPGGVIIIDNVLFRGNVHRDKFVDNRTEAIKKMNAQIRNDPRVLHCNMLGIDDGISIVIKK